MNHFCHSQHLFFPPLLPYCFTSASLPLSLPPSLPFPSVSLPLSLLPLPPIFPPRIPSAPFYLPPPPPPLLPSPLSPILLSPHLPSLYNLPSLSFPLPPYLPPSVCVQSMMAKMAVVRTPKGEGLCSSRSASPRLASLPVLLRRWNGKCDSGGKLVKNVPPCQLISSHLIKRVILKCAEICMVTRVSYRIFGLGGGIYWCINEARKCERRGLGASPPPPPEIF